MNFKLTANGVAVLLRALAGETLTFAKITLGNGDAQDASSSETTALSNELMSLDINSVERTASNIKLHTSFNNANVAAGFRLTEVGIWAVDMDNSSANILYAYGTESEANADRIAATNETILETQLDFYVFVGDAENVSASINESLVYATKAQFDAHVDDTRNPHGVTKEQVGLGEVPNLSTNDQTPTYTKAKTLSELTIGEKLSAAFGKISKAITALISHLSAKNNPHSVTALQTGAASAVHRHSSTDITSGILGVERGGTGRDTFFVNSLIYSHTPTALMQITPPAEESFLVQDDRDEPHWRTLNETGTYEGNGSFGEAHALSITFSKIPSMVVIAEHHTGQPIVAAAILFPRLRIGFSFTDRSGTGAMAYRLAVIVTGTTVTWYSDKDAGTMCNTGSEVYKYNAIM